MSSASAALLSMKSKSAVLMTASSPIKMTAHTVALRKLYLKHPPERTYCVYSNMKPFLLPMDKVRVLSL